MLDRPAQLIDQFDADRLVVQVAVGAIDHVLLVAAIIPVERGFRAHRDGHRE